MPKLLTKLKINSVASVDRGAGEDVKVVLMKNDTNKRDFSAAERRRDAKSGAAMKDGSFPIHNREDLKNAIRLAGRSKHPEAARAHIRRRAAALGLTSMLEGTKEDTNKRDGVIAKLLSMFIGEKVEKAKDALAESVESIVKDDSLDNKTEMLKQSIDEFADHLANVDSDIEKALAAGAAVDDDGANDMTPEIKKALGLDDAATDEDILKSVTELVKAKKPPVDDGDDGKDDDGDDVTKMDLPESVKKKLADYDRVQEQVSKLLYDSQVAQFSKRAIEVGLPESDGVVLLKAYQGDASSLDKILGYLKSAQAAAREAGLFKEFGTSRGDGPQSAYEELQAKAAELRKIDPKLSKEQAFAKVYADPANYEIAKRERAENRPPVA